MLTLTQLLQAGLSRTAVRDRHRAGRLHRVHRGVYAVGHLALSDHARWMAAVLACGPRAVLSHRSAAELWGLLEPGRGDIHVTVAVAGGRAHRRGIHLHRSPSLPDGARTLRDRVPVATPARTLVDLRRTAARAVFRRAVREAEYKGLDLGPITSDGTFSDLERAFLAICRRHRLPAPEVNVPIGRFKVDFLWREAGLAVETDGYAAHRGHQAFLDDRQRELELHARGWRVRRFSDMQVREQARAVAAAIRAELGRG